MPIKRSTLAEFGTAVTAALARFGPDVTVSKNEVGNIALLDSDGTFIGFIDVHSSEVFQYMTDEAPSQVYPPFDLGEGS